MSTYTSQVVISASSARYASAVMHQLVDARGLGTSDLFGASGEDTYFFTVSFEAEQDAPARLAALLQPDAGQEFRDPLTDVPIEYRIADVQEPRAQQ